MQFSLIYCLFSNVISFVLVCVGYIEKHTNNLYWNVNVGDRGVMIAPSR